MRRRQQLTEDLASLLDEITRLTDEAEELTESAVKREQAFLHLVEQNKRLARDVQTMRSERRVWESCFSASVIRELREGGQRG